MLPTVIYLAPLNTQVIQVTELQDQITGSFLQNAQVTATLLDSRGNPDPVLNNITMSYIPGTDGTYNGTVPAAFNPPGFAGAGPTGGYQLVVTAVQAGIQAQWSIPVIIQFRRQ